MVTTVGLLSESRDACGQAGHPLGQKGPVRETLCEESSHLVAEIFSF